MDTPRSPYHSGLAALILAASAIPLASAGDVYLPASISPQDAIPRIGKATRGSATPNADFNRGVEAYFNANSHRLSRDEVLLLTNYLKETRIVIPIPGPCCLAIKFDSDLTKASRSRVRERMFTAFDLARISERRESGKPADDPGASKVDARLAPGSRDSLEAR